MSKYGVYYGPHIPILELNTEIHSKWPDKNSVFWHFSRSDDWYLKGIFSSILTIVAYQQKQPQEVFYKKCVNKILSKLTGKHLRQSLFFNKVAG